MKPDAKRHLLEVKMAGFETFTSEFTFDTGNRKMIKVSLEPKEEAGVAKRSDANDLKQSPLTDQEYFGSLLELGAEISIYFANDLLTAEMQGAIEKISDDANYIRSANDLGVGQELLMHPNIIIQVSKKFDDKKLKQLAELMRRRPASAPGVALRLPCRNVTSAGLSALAGLNLIELTLAYCDVDREGAKNLRACFPTNVLVLREVQLNDDEFLELMRDAQQGMWLHFHYNSLTDRALGVIKDANPKILNISFNQITDDGLKHLEHVTSLEHLDLQGTKVSPDAVAKLHQTIPQCTIYTDDSTLAPLIENGQIPAAKDQFMPGNDQTDLPRLGDRKFFTTINELGGHTIFYLAPEYLQDVEKVRQASKESNGAYLVIAPEKLSETPDLMLAPLVFLRFEGEQFEDDDFSRLVDLIRQRPAKAKPATLQLINNSIEAGALTKLAGVELVGIELGDVTFDEKSLSVLRDLNLVASIGLNRAGLTDSHLSTLVQYPMIKKVVRLGVVGNDISDQGLAELEKLQQLVWLQLNATKVTPEGIERFRKAVPGCKILWDGGIVEPREPEPLSHPKDQHPAPATKEKAK